MSIQDEARLNSVGFNATIISQKLLDTVCEIVHRRSLVISAIDVEQIIESFQIGDLSWEESVERLYRGRLDRYVSNIARAELRSKYPACHGQGCYEDVSSEFWQKLPERLKSFTPAIAVAANKNDSGVFAWIKKIIRNDARNHGRKHKGSRHLTIVEDLPEDGRQGVIPENELPSTIFTTEKLFMEHHDLDTALENLKDIERTILLLRYQEGLTREQIEKIVGKAVPPPRYDDGRHQRSREYQQIRNQYPDLPQQELLAKLGIFPQLSFEYIAEIIGPTQQGKQRTAKGVEKIFYVAITRVRQFLKEQGYPA